MKRTIITSALILSAAMGFSQPASDRKPQTPEQVAQREANALSERLSLTEDQRSKAYSIYLDKATKEIAAREARMKEMQQQRELGITEEKQQQDKINQLLNADQKKTYENLRERMNDRRLGPGGALGMRQGPQGPGLGFRRGPGEQFQGPRPGDRFQRGPAEQFNRPEGPRSGFQRGPGQEFQQPGAPGQRFQSRPDGQFQGRGMAPNFQGRPDGQNRFQGRPGGPNRFQQERFKDGNFRHKMSKKFHKHMKHRVARFKKQSRSKDLLPESKTAPADNNK
ncbi:MAG TPA: hypothetical protein DIT07_02815 [Sphingobacteriaceae bacterium]|nr:hypothetical protein [Sphingobacteriaceae bacterium]